MANISNQNQVTERNTSTQVHVVHPDAGTVVVPRRETETVTVSAPGPQGIQGVQGLQGASAPFTDLGSGVWNTTSSIQVTGSFTVSGSSTFTNIGPAVFSGSVTINGAPAVTTATLASLTASSARTASYLNTLNQDLIFNGNLTLNGTASISYLNVQYESASVIYSSGSNQLGDAPNDTQTLYGSVVIPTGSLVVSGSTIIRSNTSPNTDSIFQVLSGRTTSSLNVINNNSVEIGANRKITFYPDVSNNNGSFISLSNLLKSYELYSSGINGGVFFIYNRSDSKSPIVVTPDKIGLGINTDYSSATLAGAALIVTASNIGIGTAAPTASLHISASNSSSAYSFLVQNSSGQVLFSSQNDRTVNINSTNATNGNTTIGTTNGTITFNQGYNNTFVGNALTFYNGGVASTIQGFTTNPGIAVGYAQTTTNPNTGSVFTVKGTATTSGSGVLFVTGSSATKLLRVSSEANANILVVSGSGNIGVGVASPQMPMDVLGAIRSQNGAIYTTNVYSNAASNTYLGLNGTTSAVLGLHNANMPFTIGVTTGAEIMRISGSGDVGIGTSAPTARLHISGSSNSGLFEIDSPALSDILYVSGSGNIGIGTRTPAYNLEVFGSSTNTARFYGGSGTAVVGIGVNGTLQSSGGQFRLHGNSSVPLSLGSHGVWGDLWIISGNVGIGQGTTAPTLTSRFTIKGSGATSSTTALRVENTNTSASMVVLDNGYVGINTGSAQYNLDVNGTARLSDVLSFTNLSSLTPQGTTAADRRLLIRGGEGGGVGSTSLITLTTSNNITSTSGNPVLVNISRDFTPTSGTATYTLASITGTINQTGGANGITRGIYIAPTLTAAADFRAIETTAGNVLFQSGSTPLLVVSSSGFVGIGTNTPSQPVHIVNSSSAAIRIQNVGGSSADFSISAGNGRLEMVGNGASAGRITIGQFAKTVGINQQSPNAALDVIGSGATSATNTLLVRNSTPTTLLTIIDNGQVEFTSPTITLATTQSAFRISPIISASNTIGGQYYGVNITPTFYQTTASQTETAFRVAATFSQSSAAATSGTNIIADFGSTSAGSQLTVTDVTSGSIYMVNDVSGLPIIEATSNWDVNIYDFPNKIFEKTGSQVNIYGTLRVSGSFVLPLSQSAAPQIGSAYWSGSLLFIYNGTRYMSSSFA